MRLKNAVVSGQSTGNQVHAGSLSKNLSSKSASRISSTIFGADHPQAMPLKAEKVNVGGQIFQNCSS